MSRVRRKTRSRAELRDEPLPQASEEKSEGTSLGDYIRRQRELANVSLRKLSEQSGISAAVLKEIESGLRHPSRTLLQSLAGALRLSAETLYLQAGVLDPKGVEESPAVREIRRDPHLTVRQRDMLVEIYSAFRMNNRRRQDS
jgi:transcriptional regulator with XRE-family HTH domain